MEKNKNVFIKGTKKWNIFDTDPEITSISIELEKRNLTTYEDIHGDTIYVYNDIIGTRQFDKDGKLLYARTFKGYQKIYLPEDEDNPAIWLINLHDKTIREVHIDSGIITTYEYDEYGELLRASNNTGYEEIYEYDVESWKNITTVHIKDPLKNTDILKQVNLNGDVIYIRDNINITEERREYDDNRNLIYHKNTAGFERWFEYDDNGRCRYYKDSTGERRWTNYDDQGRLTHYKSTKGEERNFTYNEDGSGTSHYKRTSGTNMIEWWKDFNIKGQEIHYKDSTGLEEWYGYDINGVCYTTKRIQGEQ